MPLSSARAADDLGGNPVPGICPLSRAAVFAQAKVGDAASKRLKPLAEQARSPLANQRKPIDAARQSFQEKAPSRRSAAQE